MSQAELQHVWALEAIAEATRLQAWLLFSGLTLLGAAVVFVGAVMMKRGRVQ